MRRLFALGLGIAVACAAIGVTVSSLGSTSTAAAAPAAPRATTGAAINVAQSSARVTGTVNPAGTSTHYFFQYGPTAGYGTNTASTDAGAGTSAKAVGANLSGLASGTTYHYRLVAVSSAGTTPGTDRTFTTTTPPVVTTGTPSQITPSTATVTGRVNPEGRATTYFFRYGTTTGYGTQTTPAGAGAGTDAVGVHAVLTGLAPRTTYHYQLVAHSPAGTTFGADQTLTTNTSQAVVLGREGFVSPGRVVGVELGCFHGTTTCTGHLTMAHNGTVIAQRNYSIRADHGGFQNMKLTRSGARLLKGNRVFHLLPVTVTAAGSDGQNLTFTIHLARWVWH